MLARMAKYREGKFREYRLVMFPALLLYKRDEHFIDRLTVSDAILTFLSMLSVLAAMLYVGQGHVNILPHLQPYRPFGASSKLFLNPMIQCYLNNVTNLHQLTSHCTTLCPTADRIVTIDYCDFVTLPYLFSRVL